ncbi:MAG: tetratricopeptide repeat protein, partial [Bryobacterales bacterium]|nr:tetratricopeptide repeat protein [Bryobacterales bacterium]
MAAQEERDLFAAGEKALRAGDYASARTSFEQVLKRNPKHLAALANLGVVFAQTRDYEQAAATYRKTLALNPAHPLLHLNLGLALFKQDRYAEAAKEFEQTLARQPTHLQAQELLASCRIYTG